MDPAQIQEWLVTILIAFPLVAALLIAFFVPGDDESGDSLKKLAIGVSVVEFLLSLPLVYLYEPDGGYQFVKRATWIHTLNAEYYVGIDGLSLWLVILSTFTVPIALIASYNSIYKHVKEYLVLMLILTTGMVGVFVSLDLLLFYLFWEVMLIPMYFIIGIWGGERRVYAAIKFVLFTMAGSLLMLVAIIGIYLASGPAGAGGELTFSIPAITGAVQDGKIAFGHSTELAFLGAVRVDYLLFGAFALAFLIKVPLFPFHTWLPDAHVEAPTAGSVILAAVLLKMGTYGLLRFNLPFFPQASVDFAPLICTLAVIGIIYGALVAMVQPDVKKLVAYSSVSHLGFCVLGIFSFTPQGLQGSLMQMLAHGLSTGALFLLIGVIYDRRHTRLISEFGGLARVMPNYATIFLIITFASIGLPLLAGFVGEFLTILGTFNADPNLLPFARGFAVLAATAMVWGAVYMLWMYQRVVMGEVTKPENLELQDLTRRELGYLLPVVALTIAMGVYPNLFMSRSQPTLDALLVGPLAPAQTAARPAGEPVQAAPEAAH